MELSSKEIYKNQKVSLAVTILSFVVTMLFLYYVKISSTKISAQTNERDLNLTLEQNTNLASDNLQTLSGSLQENQPLLHENNLKGFEALPIKDITHQIADNYSSKATILKKEGSAETSTVNSFTPDKVPSANTNLESNTELGFSLTNRDLVVAPHFSKTTSEIGTVVVNITVDKNGRVIDAVPNGRGTTTSSSQLKKEAKEMAFATEFSKNQKLEEQKGTITIIFSYN